MILTDSTEVRDQLERGRQSEVETPVRTPENSVVNTVETADEYSGELVRQRHGGALKRGGNWGNRGGGSRSLGFKRRLV